MTQNQHIEADKIAFYSLLELQFPVRSLDALVNTAGQLDQVLLMSEIPRLLIERSRVLFGAASSDQSYRSFVAGGQKYALKSAKNLADPGVIEYAVVRQPFDGRAASTTTAFSTGSFGPFSSVSLTLPDELKGHAAGVEAYLKEIIGVGYRWIHRKVVDAVRQEGRETSAALYGYLYDMLGQHSLFEGFLLSCVFDDKDFVLLDDTSAGSLIELAESSAPGKFKSPVNLVLHLIGQIVPAIDSPIKDACVQGMPIRVALDASNSDYYRASPELRLALSAVWKKSVTCYPIAKKDRYLLAAFFPSTSDVELLPFLDAHRQNLGERADANLKRIVANLAVLQKAQWAISALSGEDESRTITTKPEAITTIKSWSKFAAELAGRFVKGYNE